MVIVAALAQENVMVVLAVVGQDHLYQMTVTGRGTVEGKEKPTQMWKWNEDQQK